MNLPEGFITSIKELPGVDSDSFLRAMEEAPAVGVRLNPAKTCTRFDGEKEVAWCRSGRYLAERPQFTLMPELHAGAFYVQDPSSMIHQRIIAQIATRGTTLLDLCAAPGGKTTACLSSLPEDCVAVANEVVPARARILQENLRKWGRPDVIVTSAAASELGRLQGKFDIIVADVPCSGEGMMRKDEEARRQWNPGLTQQCATLQREIIADILPALAPGGWLVYSTCTFNIKENEENVRYFIEEYGLESVAIDVDASWGIGQSLDPHIHALRFMPHLTRGEGLFVTLLRKPYDGAVARSAHGKPARPEKTAAAEWVKPQYNVYRFGTKLRAMSTACASLLSDIEGIKSAILDAGTEIGEVKGRDIVPSAALPLSGTYRPGAFPEREVTEAEALSFLRREPLVLPNETPKGYVIITYKGLRLGIVKNLGNRTNNLYQKEWRVRI